MLKLITYLLGDKMEIREFKEEMEKCTVETCDHCGMEFWMHPEFNQDEDELKFCDSVCENRYNRNMSKLY